MGCWLGCGHRVGGRSRGTGQGGVRGLERGLRLLADRRRGIDACTETVRSITVELGLKSCQPGPWRHNLTERDGALESIPDLVARDFTDTRPGEKFVGDITYSAQFTVMCNGGG